MPLDGGRGRMGRMEARPVAYDALFSPGQIGRLLRRDSQRQRYCVGDEQAAICVSSVPGRELGLWGSTAGWANCILLAIA